MSATQRSEIVDEDREMARTVAISLGSWLAITAAAVVLLLLFGEPLANLLL